MSASLVGSEMCIRDRVLMCALMPRAGVAGLLAQCGRAQMPWAGGRARALRRAQVPQPQPS
eukprot:6672131-Alexandrium_andersonii.AAC.1